MKYLTFPITLLKPPHQLRGILEDIVRYNLYVQSAKHGSLERGLKYLEINIKTDTQEVYNRGKEIFMSVPKKTPMSSIRTDLILEFNNNEKSEFDNVCFLAYIALRSIIQKQSYTKATNDYLLNRMVGNSSKGGILPQWIMKYNNEYQMKKIKQALQLKFGLKYYAYHTRGFWFSFSMPLDALVLIAERNKLKSKAKQLQIDTKKAREQALNILKREHDL